MMMTDEYTEEPQEDLNSSLKARRRALAPFGKKEIFDVPGYEGLLGIEFQYVGSEITEEISRRVIAETRMLNGKGISLLSSLDLIHEACFQIVKRNHAADEWKPIQEGRITRFDTLPSILEYDARDGREAVLELFGSEHAVLQMNVKLSRWLVDVTKTSDDDFLGL